MTHFRIRWALLGAHVHVSVWSAPTEAETHGRNGQLIFREAEWEDFRIMLQVAMLQSAHPVLLEIIKGGGDPA